MRLRPAYIVVAAIVLPLLLVVVNVVVTYEPGLPFHPPRAYSHVQFWVPLIVSLAVVQLMRFPSVSRRLLFTIAWGVAVLSLLFVATGLAACSYGNCL